jgi:hypothetical protein
MAPLLVLRPPSAIRNFRYTPDARNRNQAQWSCQRLRMRRCNIFRRAEERNYKLGSCTFLSRLP